MELAIYLHVTPETTIVSGYVNICPLANILLANTL